MMMLCFACLVGCSSLPIDIETNADVTGNGTLAVQKAPPPPLVNGYTAIADMNVGDNNGGNNYAAIYRAKLDEDYKLTYDENGNLQNAERIVDKVAGFDKTQLYIFGDYLYYATPNVLEPVDSSVNRFQITDFCRIKLNGEGNHRFYQTPKASEETTYEFYATEQHNLAGEKQVYLAVYQESELVIINCYNGNEVFKKEVSSCAMPKVSAYVATNNTISVQEQTIYYTRSATSSEAGTGNVFASIKLGESAENIIAKGNFTYEVKASDRDGVLFTKKNPVPSDANAYYFYKSFSQDGSLAIEDATQVDWLTHDSMLLCQNGNGFIYDNSGSLVNVNSNGVARTLIEGKSLTALCISNNSLYAYDENKSIYKINYTDNTYKIIYDTQVPKDEDGEEPENWPEPYFDAGRNFSVTGNYAYFYVKYTGDTDSGYYLNRVNLNGDLQATLVGVLQSNHIKTPSEE